MSVSSIRNNGAIRVDKLLWYLRLVATRKLAQAAVAAGHIRLNGQRAVKPAANVAAGDVLTLPLRGRVLVIEITALPLRRGPAHEVVSCYRHLSAAAASDSQHDPTP